MLGLLYNFINNMLILENLCYNEFIGRNYEKSN